MLINIPKTFTPDLLRLLMALGHGERLLLADANYPARTNLAPGAELIYLPVESIAALAADVLRFFPLDDVPEQPALVMEKARESGALAQYERLAPGKIAAVERYAFYDHAKTAVGIILTADVTPGANLLLQKGVVNV